MTKYLYVIFISLLSLKTVTSIAASQPTFSLVALTPTSINVPANRQTIVQYRVTNNTAITRTLTMVPIPNVSQVTADNTECSNPFTLAKNQSCKLTLLVDGALQTSNYSGGPVVCKTKNNSNTPDPFLCSQPDANMVLYIQPTAAVTTTTNKLYVSNWSGNSISLCYINNTDGALEHCLVSAVSNTFANPEALAINGDYLFIANIGGGISSCAIDSITGELSNCQNAIIDGTSAEIHAPDGIAINGVYAYISNSGPSSSDQGMSICTISGSFLSGCVFSTNNDANFSTPSDIAFYNNYLYITNFENQKVSNCSPSGCGTSSFTDLGSNLNRPEGITFANINSIGYAYFTNNQSNTVSICTTTTSSTPTTFNSCATTGGNFSGFGNLAILPAQLKAYIPNGSSNTIGICNVNSDTGTISSCVNSTDTNFNNPSGLVIN